MTGALGDMQPAKVTAWLKHALNALPNWARVISLLGPRSNPSLMVTATSAAALPMREHAKSASLPTDDICIDRQTRGRKLETRVLHGLARAHACTHEHVPPSCHRMGVYSNLRKCHDEVYITRVQIPHPIKLGRSRFNGGEAVCMLRTLVCCCSPHALSCRLTGAQLPWQRWRIPGSVAF